MSKVKFFKIHSCRKTDRQILRFNEMFVVLALLGSLMQRRWPEECEYHTR
jgi:hypothetical protein